MQANTFCLDGDAALALEVHGIENLFVHFARRERPGHLEETIRERGFAVVDVRDDAEISNELRVHCSGLQNVLAYQFSQLRAGFEPPARFFRRACRFRTSDTCSAKTVPYKHSVCHNSQAASARSLIHAKCKVACRGGKCEPPPHSGRIRLYARPTG